MPYKRKTTSIGIYRLIEWLENRLNRGGDRYAATMILERFPALRRLPNSEKMQLVVDLLEERRESKSEISDPVLLEILHRQRESFEANPNTARRWEEVRDDLLRRASH